MAPEHFALEFAFVDAGRTFTCHVEPPRYAPAESWWWFDVSTERDQRHAPFRASATDTRRNVQARVVAYYENLLARRAAPPAPRWGRRAAAPGAPTGAPADAPSAPPSGDAPPAT